MDIRDRIQPSDWVAGIGGLILFISIFLEWYKVKGLGGVTGFSLNIGISGWDATKLTIFIFLFALAAMAVVGLRIADVDLSAIPVPMGIIVMGLGGVSLLIIVIRVFIKQSGLGVSYGIFVSLIAAAAVLVGGVLMQREEVY
jgi:hypothetical protein